MAYVYSPSGRQVHGIIIFLTKINEDPTYVHIDFGLSLDWTKSP